MERVSREKWFSVMVAVQNIDVFEKANHGEVHGFQEALMDRGLTLVMDTQCEQQLQEAQRYAWWFGRKQESYFIGGNMRQEKTCRDY